MNQQIIKDEILNRIKAGKPKPRPLPDVPMYPWPGDPTQNFIDRLVAFDGRAVKCQTREEALTWLAAQPELDKSRHKIYSTANGFEGNFTESDLSDLGNAHKIDVCVTEGIIGVGEMGAIWVTDQSLGHAACALLCRKLYLLLDAGNIIGGLHEAYAKLKISDHQYGCFFTGPSATADIEAVHITGAQGPLGMIVLLYNCSDAKTPPEVIANPEADQSVWMQEELNDD